MVCHETQKIFYSDFWPDVRKYRLILSDDLGNKHSSLTALTPQSLYYSFRKLTAKLDWLIPAAVGVKHSYFSVLRHLFRHGRGWNTLLMEYNFNLNINQEIKGDIGYFYTSCALFWAAYAQTWLSLRGTILRRRKRYCSQDSSMLHRAPITFALPWRSFYGSVWSDMVLSKFWSWIQNHEPMNEWISRVGTRYRAARAIKNRTLSREMYLWTGNQFATSTRRRRRQLFVVARINFQHLRMYSSHSTYYLSHRPKCCKEIYVKFCLHLFLYDFTICSMLSDL